MKTVYEITAVLMRHFKGWLRHWWVILLDREAFLCTAFHRVCDLRTGRGSFAFFLRFL